MAIKTRYRIKNSRGEYEIVHFQTSADQIITDENFQFVTLEEKEQIAKPKHYVHNQIASTHVWKINHNLGKIPSATTGTNLFILLFNLVSSAFKAVSFSVKEEVNSFLVIYRIDGNDFDHEYSIEWED